MTLKADFVALQNAADRIGRAATFMNTEMETLRTTVSSVFDTGGEGTAWSGDAQREYSARQREWDDAARQLNGILADLGAAVQRAKEDLEATENNNRLKFI